MLVTTCWNLSTIKIVTAIDVNVRMPSVNQRPTEFERARVPAVETPFEFCRAKEPSMKRSLDGKMDAWRREYVRTRCCTGNARSTSWIFKAIPAVQVCERARIAALPLQEIWSRLVLPGLVVFEHSRGGNGIGVILRQQIAASALGMALSVLE